VSTAGRIRLYGVDTPEIGQRCSQEATDRMRQLAGDTVRVESGPRSTDQYGRLLFYLYTSNGESIDEILLREGLARIWTRDGQHREYLSDVEFQAYENHAGCLWEVRVLNRGREGCPATESSSFQETPLSDRGGTRQPESHAE
jgi:endonuclease YncB( thermonuclease family)